MLNFIHVGVLLETPLQEDACDVIESNSLSVCALRRLPHWPFTPTYALHWFAHLL